MKILQVSLLSIFLIANIQAAASTQSSGLAEINAQKPVAPSVNQPDLTNLPPFYYVFLTMFFKTFLENRTPQEIDLLVLSLAQELINANPECTDNFVPAMYAQIENDKLETLLKDSEDEAFLVYLVALAAKSPAGSALINPSILELIAAYLAQLPLNEKMALIETMSKPYIASQCNYSLAQ
jgi:hypothetical protein